MTMLQKNRNPSICSKSNLKGQTIRNLDKAAQPDGRN